MSKLTLADSLDTHAVWRRGIRIASRCKARSYDPASLASQHKKRLVSSGALHIRSRALRRDGKVVPSGAEVRRLGLFLSICHGEMFPKPNPNPVFGIPF